MSYFSICIIISIINKRQRSAAFGKTCLSSLSTTRFALGPNYSRLQTTGCRTRAGYKQSLTASVQSVGSARGAGAASRRSEPSQLGRRRHLTTSPGVHPLARDLSYNIPTIVLRLITCLRSQCLPNTFSLQKLLLWNKPVLCM